MGGTKGLGQDQESEDEDDSDSSSEMEIDTPGGPRGTLTVGDLIAAMKNKPPFTEHASSVVCTLYIFFNFNFNFIAFVT